MRSSNYNFEAYKRDVKIRSEFKFENIICRSHYILIYYSNIGNYFLFIQVVWKIMIFVINKSFVKEQNWTRMD